ncbi:MAG: hypothetical protein KKH88_04555 [Nanoarchaeota archaeon]|nr:hypothetical protein [Nanoarchaeota archaeon]
MKKRFIILILIILVLIISSCQDYPELSGKVVDEKEIAEPTPISKSPDDSSLLNSPSFSGDTSNIKKVEGLELTEATLVDFNNLEEPDETQNNSEFNEPIRNPIKSPSLITRILDFFENLFNLRFSPVSKIISHHEPAYVVHNSGTEEIDITLYTLLNSDCRYYTDADTNFEDMPHNLEGQELQHTITISSSPGRTYNLYVKCNDSTGEVTDTDYNITYRILPEIDHQYPRVALVMHPCVETTEDVENLSRYDYLVMHKRHTWDTLDCNTEQIREIRELNSNIMIIVHQPQSYIYQPLESWPGDNSYPQSDNIIYPLVFGPVFFGDSEDRWILTDTNGDTIEDLSPTSWTSVVVDTSKYCPPDITTTDDWDFNSHNINYTKEVLVDPGLWDGIFWDSLYDGISWMNPYLNDPIDLNHDGVADGSTWLNQQWAEGIASFTEKAREELGPDIIFIANGQQEYYSSYNGRMIENFRFYEWEQDFGRLLDWDQNAKEPKLNFVVSQFSEPITSYQLLRAGLGATLLTDTYHQIANGGYTSYWWLDEYAVDFDTGEAVLPTVENNWKGKHYLEEPTSNAYTLDYPLDPEYIRYPIYRRNFTNGIVIVNPNYNSTCPSCCEIDIELEKEYRKILGTQDSKTNNGSIVSQVHLKWRDAIILLNTIEIEEENGDGGGGGGGGDSGESSLEQEEDNETSQYFGGYGTDCFQENQQECINVTAYHICDGLLWSLPISCEQGYICHEGECILEPQPEQPRIDTRLYWFLVIGLGILLFFVIFFMNKLTNK